MGYKINESNPTLQETQWGKQCNVNGRVSAAERTLTSSSLLSGRRTVRTPSIMLSGVLCSKMCTEFRLWVWRISKTECVPAGPV